MGLTKFGALLHPLRQPLEYNETLCLCSVFRCGYLRSLTGSTFYFIIVTFGTTNTDLTGAKILQQTYARVLIVSETLK